MKLHVELGKSVIQSKDSKTFAVWLSARHLFPCGHFEASKENVERIGSLIKRKERAVRRLISLGYAKGLFRGRNRQGRLYIQSYGALLKRNMINSKSCFNFEITDLPYMQEKLFSVYLEHLIGWRRHHRKQGKHDRLFWGQSYKYGEGLSLLLRRDFDPAMLSVSYLGKTFNLSNATVFKIKARAIILKYLKSTPRLVPLIDFDRSELIGLRENKRFEGFIVFREGKYCFNATNYIKFPTPTRFFSRSV